jgi:hypothetical protein
MKRGKLRKNAGFVVAVAIVLLAVMGGTAASVYAARGQGQGEPLATGEVGTEAAEEDLGVLPEDFAGPSGDELEMLAGQLGSSLGGSITSMVSAYAGCISDIDYTISELGEWYDNISGEIEAVKKDIVELKASSEEDSSDSASQIRALEERQSGLEAELAASVDEVRAGLEQLIGNLASQAGETDGKIMKYVELVEAAMECDLGELKARLEGVADDANGSLGSLTGRVTANEDSIAGINDAMDELKKSVSDGKSSLASAITVEGVATSSDASYAVLADNVGRLSAARYNAGYGAGVLDTKKGTATVGMVLKGSTFTSVLGVEMEGGMPDNGSLDWKPSGQETYNVPFGYYSGGTLDSSEVYNSGVSEGYDSGYGKGKSDGYATGYSKGTSEGYNSGYSKGTSDGYATGYNKGTSEGYNSGYSKGKSDGYDSGYSQGYNAGCKDSDKEMAYYSGWLSPAYSYEEDDEDECNAFVLKLPSCSWSIARTNTGNGHSGTNWVHGGPTEYTFTGPNWHASDYTEIWVEAWYLPE